MGGEAEDERPDISTKDGIFTPKSFEDIGEYALISNFRSSLTLTSMYGYGRMHFDP